MSKRVFLIVWIVILFILGGLAAWFTFGPALRNKAAAFTNYQQTLGLPGQGTGGKLPVQVGISIEKILGFFHQECGLEHGLLRVVPLAAAGG